MAARGRVEHFQSFDVHVLHRMRALQDGIIRDGFIPPAQVSSVDGQ